MKPLILLLLLVNNDVMAQANYISYFANKTIAVEKRNDSVFFYNNSGSLIRLIDLKDKKSIHYGLPIKVQNLIYYGDINQENINDNTFQTFLYFKKIKPVSEYGCTVTVFYNQLGLKSGYKEECPDDTGGDNYVFGDKDIYQYNDFGQLTTVKGRKIKDYDENGNMVSSFYRFKYFYKKNRLVKRVEFEHKDTSDVVEITKFKYNDNNQLIAMISYDFMFGKQQFKSMYTFEYNSKNLITKVQEHNNLGERAKIFLKYVYDENSKIIETYSIIVTYSSPNKSLKYEYNSNGYVVKITGDNGFLRLYEYGKLGQLVSVTNKRGRSIDYTFYDFEKSK